MGVRAHHALLFARKDLPHASQEGLRRWAEKEDGEATVVWGTGTSPVSIRHLLP